MATVYPTVSPTSTQALPADEPEHIDLLRRYSPTLAVHTHAQIAAHVAPDAQGCWPWDGYITPEGYV